MPITADEFRGHLSYDPETGIFRRLKGSYRGAKPGDIAGSRHIAGYVKFCLLGRSYLAHRAAFFHMTGEWPSGDIDHINGDRSDNRWANLRLATRSQNCCNSQKSRRNSSGHKGIRFHQEFKKWTAEVGFQGRRLYLGSFDTAEEAKAAYLNKAAEMHGEFFLGASRT